MKVTKSNCIGNPWLRVQSFIFLLLILLLPATAGAAEYWVWGRVYSASPLTDGEEPPTNPLTGVPPEQIIGGDMVALTPRNLVKVRVIDTSSGSELASYIVSYDGGYIISFNAAGGGVSVQFLVEELTTSKVLLNSEPVDLSPWPTPNIRFLLALEGLTEIGDDREFALCTPGTHTGIFTRVGKIEVATEVGGTTQHLINTSTGRVTVPASVSSDLHIPAYKDAPLGGNLYIFGAFDQPLYSSTPVRYRVRIEDLDTSTATYMSDPLVKTKYTVNLGVTPVTVSAERKRLGPELWAGTPNCYKMTELSTSSGGVHTFWSFPDLLALWRTGERNGGYRVTLEVVGLPPGSFVPVPDFTDLTVFLDNVKPVANILPLEAGDPDTPLIYIPSPPATGIGCDLIDTRLGSYPGHYGGAADPTCSILDLEGPMGSKYLAFKLTAHHDNGDGVGYLRYWHFKYRRNDTGYQIHIGKKFDGSSMVDYSTVQFSSTETDTKGFQDKFLYLNNTYLQPGGGISMGSCAYRFIIAAATRTTDGYHYLRWAWDEDIHYVQR